MYESYSVILASLHVCVPEGTTLEQWEKTEQYLQSCFAAYGISHVTISPEIQRDTLSRSTAVEDIGGEDNAQVAAVATGGRCGLPSHDEYGCSVSDMKKRRVGAV